MPRDQLALINKLIGAPRPEKLETEPESEQNETGGQDTGKNETGAGNTGAGAGTKAGTGTGTGPRAETGAKTGTATGQDGMHKGQREGTGGSRGSVWHHRGGKGYGSVGARRNRSRSQVVDHKIQAARQSRIPVYVYREGDPENPSVETPEAKRQREAIGEAAEEFVYRQELEKGHKVERMSQGHPGYDIEVIDQQTGELRFIEVKGQDGDWGERGVGLSHRQFQQALENGAAYWLYIVERARSPQPKMTRIQNPVGRITEYRFDSSWAQLAAQSSEIISSELSDHDTLVEHLKAYTEDAVCKRIIDACYQKDLELPVVGYELADEDGVVTGEVELAWPRRRTAVVLSAQNEAGHMLEDWQIFRAEDVPVDLFEFELYGFLSAACESEP